MNLYKGILIQLLAKDTITPGHQAWDGSAQSLAYSL